jgi:hypothetical protein
MSQVLLDRDEVDDLPRVCMRCGQPSAVVRVRTFSWTPSWVALLLLAGLLPYIIVALILTKRMRVEVPLCAAHKGHWFWRAVLIWGSMLVLGALAILGIAIQAVLADQGGGRGDETFAYVCWGSIGLLLVWIVIVAVAQQTAIRPVEITDDTITLTGVSPDFRHALKELEADEEEEEDWPRRPKRSHHVRESKPPQKPLPPDSYREAEE